MKNIWVKSWPDDISQYKGQMTDNEMIAWAKNKMAAYKYPRIVEFVDELPKTRSGKMLKRALRDRENNQH